MIEIILPSLLVGLLLAIIAGPLGAFVVWGRMAYLGDTLAHSTLLGVGLAMAFGVHLMAGVLLVTALIAVGMSLPGSRQTLSNDTVLGILAHGSLALGLVIVSLAKDARADMMALLLGDVLAATYEDVILLGLASLVLMASLTLLWNRLLNLAINQELAEAEGLPVHRLRLALMLLLALAIAIGMQVVGALLLTAMLIIPAATARRLARTPEQMALFASVVGMLAVIGGLGLSFALDTPGGPSIVLAACGLFITVTLLPLRDSQ